MGHVEFVDDAGDPDENRLAAADATEATPRRLLGARGTWLTAGAGVIAAGAALAVVLYNGTSAANTDAPGSPRPADGSATSAVPVKGAPPPANVGWYTQATEDPGAGYGLSSLRECDPASGVLTPEQQAQLEQAQRDAEQARDRADHGTGDPGAVRLTPIPAPSEVPYGSTLNITLDPCPPSGVQAGPPTN
jgi:hypothetical protein